MCCTCIQFKKKLNYAQRDVFYFFDVFHNLDSFDLKGETQHKYDGHMVYKACFGII
jgi:hypothetical protein